MKYFLNDEMKNKIISNIKIEATPDRYYFIMVILSCVIATYGLLLNSVSVIIGAMLIAPLMFPILKSSISLLTGNNELFKTAIVAELAGVFIAVIFSVLLTLFLPVSGITPEIIARTKPTLIDLLVAFASGLAGSIAICYRPSSAILPGIAIASALMPPLCVIGIGIAIQDFNVAGGALLLFLSNIIAINVASILVFKFVGFGNDFFYISGNEFKKEIFPKRFIYPLILLVIISLPLLYFMNESINNTRLENLFSTSIKDAITLIEPHSELMSMNFSKKDKGYIVNASIKSIANVTSSEIRGIENKLEYKLGVPVKLEVELESVNRITSLTNSMLTDEKAKADATSQLLSEISYPEDIIEKCINEKLVLIPKSELIDFSYKYFSKSGIYNIYMLINSQNPITDNFKSSLRLILERKLNRKVEINLIINTPENSN